MLELVKDVNEEIVEEATEALVENVAEDVVVNAGMSIGKKIGLVGVTLAVVGVATYGVVKLVKAKKAKNNVEDEDYAVETAEPEVEETEAE